MFSKRVKDELRENIPLVYACCKSDKNVGAKECCNRAFLRDMFLKFGTVTKRAYSDATASTSGNNHLEFVVVTDKQAYEILSVLASVDIKAKMVRRGKKYVVYIKGVDTIANVLGLLGASKAYLELTTQKVTMQVRADVNRQKNCDTANINKQIRAALKQVEAINKLKADGKFGLLDEKLIELCSVRLENKDASIEEIATLLSDKPTKSGVNHRFRKLLKLAEL
ncbi:MAG: DNA-binding protein WhiA [Firmicutes bacterium]|nr:DNA-binding protein WhiA [Bacillota bacterium]